MSFDDVKKRLDYVHSGSMIIPYTIEKYFVVSDVHIGIGDKADDFEHNADLFFHTISGYVIDGYKIVLLGDIYELWENSKFADIVSAYPRAKDLEKYIRVPGNHDWETRNGLPLGLVFEHSSGHKIFMCHGHYGEWTCDQHWKLGRFMVRYGWRRIQEITGVKDPSSIYTNPHKHDEHESWLKQWAKEGAEKKMFNEAVFGHTHWPLHESPYNNTGCCIANEGMSGIEIIEGKIKMIYIVK